MKNHTNDYLYFTIYNQRICQNGCYISLSKSVGYQINNVQQNRFEIDVQYPGKHISDRAVLSSD